MNQSAESYVPETAFAAEIKMLELHLLTQLNGRIRCFRLSQVVGGVILRGLARTYYAKQVAQHAVMQMTHLPIVANEIEVR